MLLLPDRYERLASFLLFLVAVFLLFRLFQPMIVIVLSSILVTYLFYPFYSRTKKKIHNESAAILLTLSVITLVVMIPVGYVGFEAVHQGLSFYNSLSKNVAKGTVLGFECTTPDTNVCSVVHSIENAIGKQFTAITPSKSMDFSSLPAPVTVALSKIPIALSSAAFMLFISYYLFRDWEKIKRKTIALLPVTEKTETRLIMQFKNITYTVVFAQLLVAIAQGAVTTLGFFIFGLPMAIFWGIITAFFSLIPAAGAPLVWVPAAAYLILKGLATQDNFILLKGVGLLVYGVIIISFIDNVLRVKLIRAKAYVHPVVVIVGVIGGIKLFGIPGLFLGPILLPLLFTYLETFKEQFPEGHQVSTPP